MCTKVLLLGEGHHTTVNPSCLRKKHEPTDYRIEGAVHCARERVMALCESKQQTLLLDADDTSWENNIYFERSISNFISFLNLACHSPAQVLETS